MGWKYWVFQIIYGGKMDSAEISLLVRGTDGQIKFVSEGLGIPEFYNLVRARSDSKQALVDFSPVIEALHGIHRDAHSKEILIKYNIMYNSWLDARTYTKELAKTLKYEELNKQSTALINELHISLQSADRAFLASSETLLDDVLTIKKDCDIYIDSMLCLVYAKASQDIDSFKFDVVVSSYADFLVELAERLYRQALRAGNFENSFLKYIAFEQPHELQKYLALDSDESTASFKLRCLEATPTEQDYIEVWGGGYAIRQVKIQYDSYHPNHVAAMHELRDLLYRASSLKRLVDRLKDGNIEWESGEDAVNALTQEIHIEQRRNPRLR
ncbi:hypothetical protein [Burkholderia multivorans]|uniref:hypothetical protein n=1 Tax=Burkholderia multivorans TaxID=87883 RepID=UPI0011B1E90F|nr:hypothetical protein [Burkholderia multivorans]